VGWSISSVIFDEGEGEIAVCMGFWNSEQVIAIRWNGSKNKTLGNPQSSGHATWFILPTEFGVAIVKDIILKKAAGNNNYNEVGLEKAIQWMNDFALLRKATY
jgi:hypothetical protein